MESRRLSFITARTFKSPDVPTCQEAGYDVVLGTWRGLGVPKDTPDEVVDQLYEIFSQAAQSDAFVDFMNKSNNVIDVLDGATFEERIKSDLETYTFRKFLKIK